MCKSVSSGEQRRTFPAAPRVEIDVSSVRFVERFKSEARIHGTYLICQCTISTDECILQVVLDVDFCAADADAEVRGKRLAGPEERRHCCRCKFLVTRRPNKSPSRLVLTVGSSTVECAWCIRHECRAALIQALQIKACGTECLSVVTYPCRCSTAACDTAPDVLVRAYNAANAIL